MFDNLIIFCSTCILELHVCIEMSVNMQIFAFKLNKGTN